MSNGQSDHVMKNWAVGRDIAEIQDELAVARTFSDLGRRMQAETASDIESATHQPASFLY